MQQIQDSGLHIHHVERVPGEFQEELHCQGPAETGPQYMIYRHRLPYLWKIPYNIENEARLQQLPLEAPIDRLQVRPRYR